MGALWQDLRYGWRMLRTNPGFAVVAVLTLAIGIGANTALFSIIDGVMLRPLPYPDSQNLVLIWETDANRGVTRGAVSAADLLDWRSMNHVFQEMSGWRALFYTVAGKDGTDQIWGAQVTANFFRLLGVHPLAGRDFDGEDEQPGHEHVVILSYAFWQRRFGGSASAIGEPIEINSAPYVVIGVLPKGFTLYGTNPEYELWTPLAMDRAHLNRQDTQWIIFARLRRGVPLAQAQANMETIVEAIKKEYPAFDQEMGVRVVEFQKDLVSRFRPAFLLLLGAVIFVLLISCANVANLMLTRAAKREREIAIRVVLGAGRGKILRQLLTESVLLGILGGVLGVLIAYGGLHILRAALPPQGRGQVPFSGRVGINGAALAFTFGISLLTGMVFGLIPAVQGSRMELGESLKEGSRGATGGLRSRWTRAALAVSEVALSLILLAGASLLLRSFERMMTQDMGFDPSNVLTMQIYLPEIRYPQGARIVNFFDQVIDRANALPGVQAASAVNFLPLTGWNGYCDFDIEGRSIPPSGEHFTGQYRVVDWRYFRTMKIPLKDGRVFTAADGPEAPAVAMINEAMADRYWPNQNPVGQQIRLEFSTPLTTWDPQPHPGWLTIVGVMGDVRDWAWGQAKIGELILPALQNPSRIMGLVLRAQGGITPAGLTTGVRKAVESVDPSQPVTDIHTLDDYLSLAVSQKRINMLLLGILAAIATLLAAIGIYGVMAYSVAQRSHEIGIRLALGAEPRDVLRMVVRDGMRLAGLGLVLGILGALAATRYLQGELYGIKATDPLNLAMVSVGLALIALVACYIPARRATKVDPLEALRYE
ncbi:MAG: ABC transporter permease [Candidatus Acidiferrales bacterium]